MITITNGEVLVDGVKVGDWNSSSSICINSVINLDILKKADQGGKIHKDPYLVISGYSADNLKNLVINAINKGYEPCGGLASNGVGDLFQAMVLKNG